MHLKSEIMWLFSRALRANAINKIPPENIEAIETVPFLLKPEEQIARSFL